MLKDKCTEDALTTVYEIIIAEKGNPKMNALGEAMKEKLETGKNFVCVACARSCK